MARQLRITYPGAFYHITSRGNERKSIFKSRRDREKFFEYLESATERYDAAIHAFCLMDNHFHLLLETPSGNLSQIMRHINGAYTAYFNTKRNRAGHLFQGRYWAILVEADEYAKVLSRYIHLNPVRAGLVKKAEDYEWSSYPFYIGKTEAPEWLRTQFILNYFNGSKSTAQKQYEIYVRKLEGKEYESPLDEVVSSILLGSEGFISDIKNTFVSGKLPDKDIPALKELAPKASIGEIARMAKEVFSGDGRLVRNVGIYLCQKFSGKRLKEIGVHFGIGESGVSQSSKRIEQRAENDRYLRQKLETLKRELSLSRMKT